MTMHLEFVVPGPPISNQQSTAQGKTNLAGWRGRIQSEAANGWKFAPLTGNLKAIIVNFHDGDKPSLDIDNMSKPILDVMQKLVYGDDRQIRQAEIVHLRIDAPMVFVGASKILVAAVQVGKPFVYVRIEDVADPFPLPK